MKNDRLRETKQKKIMKRRATRDEMPVYAFQKFKYKSVFFSADALVCDVWLKENRR